MYEEELEVAIKVRNLWLFSPGLIAARAANNILLLQRDFFHNIIIHFRFSAARDDKTARGQGGLFYFL